MDGEEWDRYRGLQHPNVILFLFHVALAHILIRFNSSRPLTHQTGGPLDAPLKKISDRVKAAPEQVLLAWAKAKGVVVVTLVLNFLYLECPL